MTIEIKKNMVDGYNLMCFTLGNMYIENAISPRINSITKILTIDNTNGYIEFLHDDFEDEEYVCIRDICQNLGLHSLIPKIQYELKDVNADNIAIINLKESNTDYDKSK